MNSSTDAQIKSAYETAGMSPAEIADDLGFSVLAIKSKLMAISAKYRKDCGQETPTSDILNLSQEEQIKIKEKLFDTFMASEDENVIVKLGTYLRDDGKGRKDIVRVMAGSQFNLFQFNEQLGAAREKASQVINGCTRKLIEA